MNLDSQYSNYSSSLESIPDISLYESDKFGHCIDVESLKQISTEKFLNMNSNHIIVIKNGYKFGDRRLNLEEKMLNKRNIYKDSDKNYYILTDYGCAIQMTDYLNFFKNDNKIFIINYVENKNLINYENKISYDLKIFKTLGLSIQNYLSI